MTREILLIFNRYGLEAPYPQIIVHHGQEAESVSDEEKNQ